MERKIAALIVPMSMEFSTAKENVLIILYLRDEG
jgi:hypothetical protein